MLGVHFGSNPEYFAKHVAEAQENAGQRGVKQDYYSRAVQAGEPPGMWIGHGIEMLGLSGEVTGEQMAILYGALANPTTGELLGTPLRHYASQAENLAKVAMKFGLELGPDLSPASVRAAEASGAKPYDDVLAAVAALVHPEELDGIKREAAKSQRDARNFIDLTFSPDKTWSILHAAAEATGDFTAAAEIEAADRDGRMAALEVLMREAGLARAGYHGKDAGGRSSGRWVEAPDWIMAEFVHHLSREGDPQLHTHVAVLNRVRCPDGVYRAIDGQAVMRARGLAAAVYERSAAESLTKRLGVAFVVAPNGKSRRIAGIEQETIDLFSKRSASIDARLKDWVETYKERNGEAPDARQVDAAARKIAMTRRRPKPAEMDPRADILASWEAELSEARGVGLGDVVRSVKDEGWQVHHQRHRRPGQAFDADAVVSEALEEISRTRAKWTRYDLGIEIDRALPAELGGLSPADVDQLLERLTNQALARPQVARLSAPDVIGEVPAELLRSTDGRSVYAPHDDDLYGASETLSQEQRLCSLAIRSGAPSVLPTSSSAAEGLRADQADAVAGILGSGLGLEVLVGPAGTGKSYAVATLARRWEAEFGPGTVVGLAVSENASQVLRDEGLGKAANIARWLKAQHRIAKGRPREGDEALRLVPGSLVVVDEASMVSTEDLAEISALVQAAGGKVLLSGDHLQLGAIDAGGAMGLVANDKRAQRAGAVHELVDVGRFDAPWEAEASLALRRGESAALGLYDDHGRISAGTADEMAAAAAAAFVTDHLAGRRSLLITSTAEEAAALATRVRSELVAVGQVSNDCTATLRNDCLVGPGDLIQCRKNSAQITDPSGQAVSNRDVLSVQDVSTDGALIVRRPGAGETFVLDAEYVADHVELAYASTVHAAQGRTVDTCHGLVDGQSTREGVYVSMSRGRRSNAAYVVIEHPDDEAAHDGPLDALVVLSEALERTGTALSATEVLRDQYDAAESLARLGPIWSDVCARIGAESGRSAVAEALGPEIADQLVNDPAAPALWRAVQAVEATGADGVDVLCALARERELMSARSLAEVLHFRIERYLSEHGQAPATLRQTYVDRSPAPSSTSPASDLVDYVRRLGEAMDRRVEALGERLADAPPTWATACLGDVPGDPAERHEWTQRAGLIEAYREQYVEAGRLVDVVDPIGRAPSRFLSPDRYEAWRLADDALGQPDRTRDVARMSTSALREAIEDWRSIETGAPAHVGEALRVARTRAKAAEGSFRRKSARGWSPALLEGLQADYERAAEAVQQLEATQQVRDDWWAATEEPRLLARAAVDELRHRGAGQYDGPDLGRHGEEAPALELQTATPRGPSISFAMKF